MKIPKEEFVAFDFKITLVKPFLAWGMIRKHFCPRMVQKRLCTLDAEGTCQKCHPYLEGALTLRPPHPNPIALLIWKLKDAAARAADDDQAQRAERVRIGPPPSWDRKPSSPFEAALADIVGDQ